MIVRDGFLVLTVIIVSLLAALCAIAGLQYAFERGVECPAFSHAVERPTKYNWFGGGCFVQDTDGRWVQTGNYHSVSVQQ